LSNTIQQQHQEVQRNALMLCPYCDTLLQIPPLTYGKKAVCPRCKKTLTAYWAEPRKQPLLYALCSLWMLFLAQLFSLLIMNVAGIEKNIYLIQIPTIMLEDQYASMAILFIVLVQFLPAFCMMGIILLFIPIPIPVGLKIFLAKSILKLKTWCMAEIFLAGVLVSFVKLMNYSDIHIGCSFTAYCFFTFSQVRAFQCIDRRILWQYIGVTPPLKKSFILGQTGLSQGLCSCPTCTAIVILHEKKCSRCHTYAHARRPYSLQWTMALLFSSFLLYIPANFMPMMITETFGDKITATLLSGIILLWSEGSYPIAIIVFIASILVPLLKMLGTTWLCWSIRKENIDAMRMHFIYGVIEFIGRWSMIDIFVILLLSTLVRINQFASIYPDIGALLFALMVILSMLAASSFDPRLIWDSASKSSKGKVS